MRAIVLTLLLGVVLFVPAAAEEDDRLATIHLPEGFVIEAFAEVPNARQMAWGENGTLFVGTRREGRVFAVTDEDGDGRGERVREVASGLRMPSGVAFRDGALYVAAVSTILRFDGIESRLDDPPAPAIVTDRLPSEGHHGWKVSELTANDPGGGALAVVEEVVAHRPKLVVVADPDTAFRGRRPPDEDDAALVATIARGCRGSRRQRTANLLRLLGNAHPLVVLGPGRQGERAEDAEERPGRQHPHATKQSPRCAAPTCGRRPTVGDRRRLGRRPAALAGRKMVATR